LLGYVGDDLSRRKIENILLTDSSDEVRIACAKALVTMRSIKSQPGLFKALNDKNEQVKIWSSITLALIGEKKKSLDFFKKYYFGTAPIPYSSCHIGFLYIGTSDVKPYLLKDLNNSDPNIAIDAAIILAQIGYFQDAFSFLRKNLLHSDKYIRMAALRGLAYIGDLSSKQLITSMLNDPESLVRERASSILAKLQ
jgi:HEAT repeat protein